MDQIKVGKFISSMRKEQKFTQKQLAEQLNISDKTVSKWECGKGLPEISLMLPLCELLKINVNELLSGEKLTANNYHEKAEENMMNLIKEKQENKKKMLVAMSIIFFAVIILILCAIIVEAIEMSIVTEIIIMAFAIGCIIVSALLSFSLEKDIGCFECSKCHEHFMPNFKGYILAPHFSTTRRLKCPKCGKKSYCKRKMTK